MNNPEYQNPNLATDSITRAANCSKFFSEFGKKTYHSEEWELVKIKQDNIDILLHFEKRTNLLESEELRITIIPLTSINNYHLGNYEEKYSSFKVWAVKLDLVNEIAKFADGESFEIKPEGLKNKGLGSYVLGKLVQWVKNYPSHFKVQLHAQSTDENYPNNSPLLERFYQKFNLLKAKTISDIIEPSSFEKIENLPINTKSLLDILQENIRLKKSEKELKQQIKKSSRGNTTYTTLVNSISTLIGLIAILIIILMIGMVN